MVWMVVNRLSTVAIIGLSLRVGSIRVPVGGSADGDLPQMVTCSHNARHGFAIQCALAVAGLITVVFLQ